MLVALIMCLARIKWCSAADELVTIYPTYGYQDQGEWVIPLRLWIRERRVVAESVARRVIAELKDASPAELNHFRSRAADFLADCESLEVVSLEKSE